MSILICDLCGTPFPDSVDQCPTCGYGRAFEAAAMTEERQHTAHEKVRGGRFSKKNVRRRLQEKTEPDDRVAPVPAEARQEEVKESVPVPVPEPAAEPAAEILEEPVAEPAEEPVAAPAEEPAVELPLLTPVEPAAEPEAKPEPTADAEDEKKQKILAVYRRDVVLNLALFFAGVLLVGSLVYLAMNGGIDWLKNITLPGQSVIATEPSTEPATEEVTDPPTDPPTEPPTEPPTDPPTEPPTEPPTDPPTDPPTEPPTEEPTKALLDVKLTLNYYDLTFCAATHTTQLRAEGIPLEDITWISDDPSVVTISSTGLITAVGSGRTTVRAIYGDQEVTVKINCRF